MCVESEYEESDYPTHLLVDPLSFQDFQGVFKFLLAGSEPIFTVTEPMSTHVSKIVNQTNKAIGTISSTTYQSILNLQANTLVAKRRKRGKKTRYYCTPENH